jgi:hypothetical protein
MKAAILKHGNVSAGTLLMAEIFTSCDAQGNEMEPVKGWNGLYVCDDCGRIINQDTLEVIGQRTKAK